MDDIGIHERSKRRLHRRVYSVTGPNHLWHIDSNHKLVRWHFIIVGGIDGFSRFITFLECTDNNKAETVLQCFLDGVQKCGVPLRVRSDKGMENSRVAEYMIATRGPNRRSMLTGKSTHNQHIERLWRDVFEGVLSYYHDLFHFMEDEGILDIMSDIHIFTLHYVFLSKINEKLDIWQNAWARHNIRTVKKSPMKMFMSGTQNHPVDITYHGVEGNIPVLEDEEDTRPIFAAPSMPISEHCQSQLNSHCPRNWASSNHGIDIFIRALGIIERNSQGSL